MLADILPDLFGNVTEPTPAGYVAVTRRDGVTIHAKHSTHRCDARCLYATGKLCECSCGGKNHGAGNLAGVDLGMEY